MSTRSGSPALGFQADSNLTWHGFVDDRLEATSGPLAWLVALVVGAGFAVDVASLGTGTAPRQIMHAVSVATITIPPLLHLARRGGFVNMGARHFNCAVCFLVGANVGVSLLLGGLPSQFGYVPAALFAFSLFLADGFLWSLCAFPVCAAYVVARVFAGALDAGTPTVVRSFVQGMDAGVGASVLLSLMALRLRVRELRRAYALQERFVSDYRRLAMQEHRLGLLDLAFELVRESRNPLTLLLGRLDMIEWHTSRREGDPGVGFGTTPPSDRAGSVHLSGLVAQAREQVRRLSESGQALLDNVEARKAGGTSHSGVLETNEEAAPLPVSLSDLMARIRTKSLETAPGMTRVPMRFPRGTSAAEDGILLSIDADRVAKALASLAASHAAHGSGSNATCAWEVEHERGCATLSLDFPARVGGKGLGSADPLETTPTDFHARLTDWICRANGGRMHSRGTPSAPSYVFEFPLHGRAP